MAFDYFIDHAIKNVWCSPEQDLQVILQLAPIVGMNGRLRNHKVMWRDTTLPDNTSAWYIYQVGGINPTLLGLLPKQHTWVKFSDACNAENLIVDIYTKMGVNFPRFETYYLYTPDRDLVIAIRENKRITADLNTDNIYLRLYKNAFFQSNRAVLGTDYIHVEGKTVLSNQEFLDFQSLYLSYKAKPGLVYCFVDGFKAKDIDLINATVNSLVEFVYDSSIVKTVEFKINDLNVFDSTLDSKRKYLLHYSGADNQTIDYNDDIDVFLIDKSVTNKERGVYYHRNAKDAFRNVTHRDYSICVSYLSDYYPILENAALPAVIDNKNLYIRLHIRKSGYQRPLIFENSRIKELYKMNDADILGAMLNVNSNLNIWRAPNLEANAYTQIMRSRFPQITNQMVQDAYGYNGLSIVCGNTPNDTFPYSGEVNVNVPYALQTKSTAFEYDADGLLLGFYIHNTGSIYSCVNAGCKLVEFIAGIGSQITSDVFGTNNITVPVVDTYRVYYCNNPPSGPDNVWRDITGTTKYQIINNKVVWQDPAIDPLIMVRSNEKFLAYSTTIDCFTTGLYSFNIMVKQDRGTGLADYILTAPLGDLDIFLNGKSLIKGLDYQYDNGKVYLNVKEHLISALTQTQNITIRFTGFCNSDMSLPDILDTGFIEHGFFSNNKKYDIRDDKVARITIGGKLVKKSSLVFSEEHSGVDVLNVNNGRPYQLKDIVIPLKGLVGENTYSLRDKSIVIDKQVSDYLTMKLPQPPRPAPSAIPAKYQVFSPFLNKIIYLVKNNIIDTSTLPVQYNDTVVKDKCKAFEYLLKYDHGAEVGPSLNKDYVIVHPTVTTTVTDVTAAQYRFLEKALRIYVPAVVGLSPYLRIV